MSFISFKRLDTAYISLFFSHRTTYISFCSSTKYDNNADTPRHPDLSCCSHQCLILSVQITAFLTLQNPVHFHRSNTHTPSGCFSPRLQSCHHLFGQMNVLKCTREQNEGSVTVIYRGLAEVTVVKLL